MTRQPMLYQLLPEYIRFQDQENGQALEALMNVLDLEFQRLQIGMERLYDDWFIETCEPWLVPFFGDLVGLDRLARSPKTRFTWRPLVGKMIGRRRYKGTVTCLEHTANDATGWSCLARWQADALGWTQDVRATRPGAGGFLSLRDAPALERLNTPFDSSSHTVDLRSDPGTLQSDTGCRFHPLWVSAWFWRIEARPVWRGAARQVGEGCYTFDPFGQDVPLFMQPRARPGEREATKETDLSLPLRTSTLARLLDELRRAEARGQAPITPIRTWLQLYDTGRGCPIPLRSIIACDLEDWRRPGPDDTLCSFDETLGYHVEYPVLAAIDPERGRLTLAKNKTAEEEDASHEDASQEDSSPSVLASYSCGLGFDIGGGPEHQVDRRPEADAWRALVLTTPGTRSPDYAGPPVFPSLTDALAAWPAEFEKAHVRLLGSGRLEAPSGLWHLDLNGRRRLTLEASEGSRPLLAGRLEVCGRHLGDDQQGPVLPVLRLAGLWLDGDIELAGSVELDIESSTLGPPLACARGRSPQAESVTSESVTSESVTSRAVPRSHGMLRASQNTRALVRARRSILGPIRIPAECAACEIFDCVIDGALWQPGDAIAYAGGGTQDAGPPLVLERTTVLGALHAQSIEACNAYFCRRPEIVRTSVGFLKHCFAPPGDGELPSESHQLPPTSSNPCCPAPGWESAQRNENWLVSIHYGDPGYALPSSTVPQALLTGGTEGSAIGITHHLHEAERAERLPVVFENTLRSGMQARIVWVDGQSTKSDAPQQARYQRRTGP